jgi:RNA polymerase sigma-70 factor (ECF subfamily)
MVMSDDDLRRAVGDLFTGCERRMGRYLVQMVGDRELAADLLQDSFHDALRARAQLSGVRNPEAWLFGIARNRALRALRRRGRFDRALGRLARRQSQSGDSSEIVAIRDLLARSLSVEDRALVLLRYLHDFSASELAEMTGMTAEAVRQRLSRARARLLAASEHDEGATP